MSQLWNQIAGQAGIALSDEQRGKLSRYLELLLAGNQRMNLTRIINIATAEIQHIADALTLLSYLPPGPIKIADVGSGGGVPGIPLAIARPETQILLIESTKKKAVFLKQTIQELGLTNIEVSDERVEEIGRGSQRESFDIATVRAVGEMGWLAEWCLPLLRVGGKMLAMKGPRWQQEMRAARTIIHFLGGAATVGNEINLPELPGHVIVEVKKVRTTPAKYPRSATDAKGKMLG